MNRKPRRIRLLLQVAGGLLLLLILLSGGLLGRQRWAAGKAMASRELIEATYPAQDSYTPPLNSPIAANRVEVFLAVRAELAPFCPAFTELRASFSAVEAHGVDLEHAEEPPSAEQLGRGLGEARSVFRSIFRATTQLNAYGVDRNDALLEHEMGLGEFTFLNLIGCIFSRDLTPTGFLGPQTGARVYTDRVAEQLREMIGRHAMLLEEELAAAPAADRAPLEARLAVWRSEYEALGEDPERNAFADGLPPELEQALRPFGARLNDLCCPATSELDLARVVPSNQVWYDHR